MEFKPKKNPFDAIRLPSAKESLAAGLAVLSALTLTACVKPSAETSTPIQPITIESSTSTTESPKPVPTTTESPAPKRPFSSRSTASGIVANPKDIPKHIP